MNKRYLLSLMVLLLVASQALSQPGTKLYQIIIKGGHVIDPKNNLNEVMDLAIKDGKIAAVARNLEGSQAVQVVDARGMYVSPGLIDIHGHVFAGVEPDRYLSNGAVALPPDGFTFRNGVTTIVDCGGAGWKSFATFKKNIIDPSRTRVLSFLNIVGEGMRDRFAYEQNTGDMDPKLAAIVARRHKKDIVGIKVAHFVGQEWTPVDRAVEAGKLAGDIPVIVDFGESTPPLPLEELFMKHLRPGDIFTHTYTLLRGNIRETVVDEARQEVRPFVWAAQKRGILFDVGYGGASFNFSQAVPALKAGFYPTTISTDLHTGSMNASMKNQLEVMSKFVAMGMDIPSVIKASTWAPAQAIKREELGNLSIGAVADVAILKMRKGDFGFVDNSGYKIDAKQKFQCEMTIRDGRIVFDQNGIADPIVVRN